MTTYHFDSLNAELLAAHATCDGPRLAQLYGKAGQALEAQGRTDAACFFWTQAYIFALEAGEGSAEHYAGLLRDRARL